MVPFIFSLLVIHWCAFVLRPPVAFASPQGKTLGARILDAAGGRTKFDLELEKVSAQASLLRNGTDNVIIPIGQGAYGFVSRVRFEDGVSWAMKIFENTTVSGAEQGIKSLNAINECCPEIPVPRVQGAVRPLGNTTLFYYFTDWVEGHRIDHDKDYELEFFDLGTYRLKFPEKVIIQYAELFYNFTACPIDNSKGLVLYSEVVDD
jgi:hypothetical protein